jgi:hypothetical protein
MLAVPFPEVGGSVDEFRPFLNLSDDDDWALVQGWLLKGLSGRGSYPIAALWGEHGTSKSTRAKLMRALIDPHSVELRGQPRDAHELWIAAENAWILAYDNLSGIPGWLSDSFCQLSTGGGFAARELYSDTDESLLHARRPIILTGIGEVATRSDLLDRCITFDLPPIPPTQRRSEIEIWSNFEAARARILGALLDAVATALRRLPTINPPVLPRMADFTIWVSAAEPSFGLPEGTFAEIYMENQAVAHGLALEHSPITKPVRVLVERGGCQGTAETLLRVLNDIADDATRNQPGWPKNPWALSYRLRRLAPNFRATGIEIKFSRFKNHLRTRVITVTNSASTASSAPASAASAEPGSQFPGGIQVLPPSTVSGAEPVAPPTADATDPTDSEMADINEFLREVGAEAIKKGDLKTAVLAQRERIRLLQMLGKTNRANANVVHGLLSEETLRSLSDEQIDQLAQQEFINWRGPGGKSN